MRLLPFMVLAVVTVAGCARTVAPRGGDVPETSVEVVATSPDTFAILDPFDGAIRIDFDRRISERPADGQLRDAVVVSPRTGEVEVRHRRQGIEIRMEGGFRDRTVYRVTVLPTIQDLWRNSLGDSWDLFFSTGPEFEPNVLGGLVTDRLTGEEAARVRVDAIPVGEGPTHSTVADSAGIFTFPFLPADRYLVRAYDDLNRNREADFLEPQDSMEVALARGDTLIVTELRILQPDTTPAVVTAASVLDSMAVQVTFDDHLDPDLPLDEVTASLERTDGQPAPGIAEILHAHEWEARVAALAEEEPEPAEPPDPDAPDTIPPPPPPPPPDEAPDPEAADPDEEPLPRPEIVLVLDAPIEWEAEYRVVVADVTNINGVPGGGGEVEFEAPPEPEEPEPAPPDTVPPPDTIPPPDTVPRPDARR